MENNKPKCSFCGKEYNGKLKFFEGHLKDVYICNECVQNCFDTLYEKMLEIKNTAVQGRLSPPKHIAGDTSTYQRKIRAAIVIVSFRSFLFKDIRRISLQLPALIRF